MSATSRVRGTRVEGRAQSIHKRMQKRGRGRIAKNESAKRRVGAVDEIKEDNDANRKRDPLHNLDSTQQDSGKTY